MKKFSFIAVKYKYDECPVCFPRDSDAGVAFIEDLLDPREMKILLSYYQITIVYDDQGQFKGSMFTYKANHQIEFVMFCEKVWQPLKTDGTFLVYHKGIYDSPDRDIANFMLDNDPLIREYSARVYQMRENLELS